MKLWNTQYFSPLGIYTSILLICCSIYKHNKRYKTDKQFTLQAQNSSSILIYSVDSQSLMLHHSNTFTTNKPKIPPHLLHQICILEIK